MMVDELNKTQFISEISPLIYRGKLIKALDVRYYASPIAQRVCDDIILYIKMFSGADADVVYCKQCRFWKTKSNGYIKICAISQPNDYCAWGERR